MQQKGLLSHFTTDRPVAVVMVFTAAVVFGYFSFQRLPITLMPELNYSVILRLRHDRGKKDKKNTDED